MSKKTMAKAVKLPSGNWNVKVFVGYDDNGKKIRKSFTAATRWEVERQAAEYLESRNDKKPTITVGEAIDSYIASKENVLAPSTIRGYKTVRRNRLPSIMLLDITEVNSINMQFAINEDARRVEWKSINEAKNLIVAACRMYGVKQHYARYLKKKMTQGKFREWADYALVLRQRAYDKELAFKEYEDEIRK